MTHIITRDDHAATFTILSRVWGSSEGYVKFARKEPGKQHVQDQVWFAWPPDKQKIRRYVREHHDAVNVYFTPYVYVSRSAAVADLAPTDRVAIDLDGVDPTTLRETLRPALAWSTSPHRYQALWIAADRLDDPVMIKQRGRDLATAVSATDGPAGGEPKLLRVPNSLHDKGAGPVRGHVLWFTKQITDLPTPTVRRSPTSGRDVPTMTVRVPGRVRQFLMEDPSAGMDRSAVIWKQMRTCIESGMPPAQTKEVLWRSPIVRDKYTPEEWAQNVTRAYAA